VRRKGFARKLGWVCRWTLRLGLMFDVTGSEPFWACQR